ncbi:hypothetical protein CFOL_v3_02451 [Cephalotus follicularis]|uniref:Uncharacterized protein n=1 Tax=Cephalotus follicularis TaxID=3775 RepID=A0A1Q3AT52_CEPFO|nr:hypothetical protein CFOL_v3_02451 [Cephalotus follicularis]
MGDAYLLLEKANDDSALIEQLGDENAELKRSSDVAGAQLEEVLRVQESILAEKRLALEELAVEKRTKEAVVHRNIKLLGLRQRWIETFWTSRLLQNFEML